MARVETKTFQSKRGETIVIRNAERSDADALIEHIVSAFRDGEGMVLTPDEFKRTTAEEVEWIEQTNAAPLEIAFVATCKGEIVGSLDFHVAKRARLAHTGFFGMTLKPAWRGHGIGSELVRSMVDWARGTGQLEKINLQVRSDNPRGIALYRKSGFKECGRRIREVKLGDDRYVDDVHMELHLT